MKSLLVKCTVALLLISATAYTQDLGQLEELYGQPPLEGYQFDFGGGGARADAMGRAFLGLSNDVTAASWNPAGLFDLSQPIISATYGNTMPRGFTATDVYVSDFSSRFDHRGSIGGITSLNFAAPLRVKGHPFVGSFAYWTQYNEYQALLSSGAFRTIINFQSESIIFIDTINFTTENQSVMDGGLKTVTFGLGTRIYGDLSAGLGVNVYSGTMVRKSNSRTHTDDMLDPFQQEVSQTTLGTSLDSNSFSGYNVTLGVKLNKERFGVGMVIRTPFALKVETDRFLEQIVLRNGQLDDAGTDTAYFDNLLAKYDMPWMVGLGFAYMVSPRSTVTLDVEYRNFSGSGVKLREDLQLDPGGENTETFTEVSSDTLWNSLLQLRLGGEHFFQSKYGQIPIRAGFAFMPSMVPSYEPTQIAFDDSLGLVVTDAKETSPKGIRLSLGTGVWWNQIHLDFAYAYMSRNWDNGGPGQMRTGVFHEKARNHNLYATFTGYF